MTDEHRKGFVSIKEEKGASLVFALIVSFLLIVLATIIVHFVNTELKSALKQEQKSSAFFIAEAGLERAVLEINENLKSGLEPTSLFEDPNYEGGSYKVTVAPKQNEHGENIGYMIESTGHFKNERETVSHWVRQPIWPPGPTPEAFEFAVYAEESIAIRSLSGLLGTGELLDRIDEGLGGLLGFLIGGVEDLLDLLTLGYLDLDDLLDLGVTEEYNQITINGNIHANDSLQLEHKVLLDPILNILIDPGDPNVNGIASSTDVSKIEISGMKQEQRVATDPIPSPEFDFDYARQAAITKGLYKPQSVLDLSLLGLGETSKEELVFIDGNLTLIGLDLLNIALKDRTIVVNGDVSLNVSVGSNPQVDVIDSKLNIIAKGDINILGAVTGVQVDGILYAGGTIHSDGHLKVKGYTGAKNIDFGSGLLSNVLGIATGSMNFTYDPEVFDTLPQGIGFKKMYVEVIE